VSHVKIFYSCLICKTRVATMDDIENHLEDVHVIFDQEELDRSYLIHFPEVTSRPNKAPRREKNE